MKTKSFQISVGPEAIERFESRVESWNTCYPDWKVKMEKKWSPNEVYSSWIVTVKGFDNWGLVYYFGDHRQ